LKIGFDPTGGALAPGVALPTGAAAGLGRLHPVPARSAEPCDAAALRDLHVETWIATYQGRLPEPFYRLRLATLRTRDWAELLRRQSALGGGVLIAGAS
jgi:hypothetical protein